MKTTMTVLTDDLNGESADESILFGLDGKYYEIDLTEANAAELRKAFAPYVDTARRSPTDLPTNRRTASSHHGSKDLGAVRDWLRGKGHTVPAKGRIPGSLMAEYEAAH